VSSAGVVVGVDLGGTKTAAAIVERDGTTGPVHSLPTPAQSGPAAVLDAVAQLVRRVAGDARVRAVGVGTAGVVDVGRGTIVSATSTFPGWPGTDVAGGIRDRLGGRGVGGPAVFVQNDVDAHAAGEAWRGAAAGADSMLMVAVGTGVGGSVVLSGRPLRGAHHLAGEIGHMPVPGAEGLGCPCGRPGHLEALAAGPAILRRYVQLGGDPGSHDARDVVARASAGEVLAGKVVEDAAVAVGRAIAGLATVLDPEVVVVGGGVAGAGDLWWSAMERTVRAEVVDVLQALPVVPATLGTVAAVVGAARGAYQVFEGPQSVDSRRTQ